MFGIPGSCLTLIMSSLFFLENSSKLIPDAFQGDYSCNARKIKDALPYYHPQTTSFDSPQNCKSKCNSNSACLESLLTEKESDNKNNKTFTCYQSKWHITMKYQWKTNYMGCGNLLLLIITFVLPGIK